MTVPEIIRRWGYPVEVHNAVTQDGYILEMHRIPYGKAGSCGEIEKQLKNPIQAVWERIALLLESRIPVYYSHFPDGTSSLNMLHWVQMVQTGETTRLDRGTETNVAVYGQKSPPKYNFRDVPKIPIYLFSGGNDYIAVDDDIYGSLLPQIEPSVQKHTHLPEYNHFDFVFGLRATADVYKPIMNVIQNNLQ
ncbi:ab-hydrolase associated lipase region [Teladorsagia circumcincta]|uniref:Ab-hydrolase associated lipase region n=1 Tax=Teladorsagia circumcincta TaxID=45464 RepID=A0A2G9U4U8_TELCI|nr:ab-hydrolase associated lipase region [Teladorsagia circumcincta]